jgi:hypothetical protein
MNPAKRSIAAADLSPSGTSTPYGAPLNASTWATPLLRTR